MKPGIKENYECQLTNTELDRYVKLISKCYDIEQKQTLEEDGSTASYNDALVIETIRLGGPTGLPKGLYPVEITAEIFDKAANVRISKPTIGQEIKQYSSDIRELKKRLKGSKNPAKHVAELFASDYPFSLGVGQVLIDRDTGKGYEIEGFGTHMLSKESLLETMIKRNIASRDEGKKLHNQLLNHNLIYGFFLAEQNIWELTKEIDTRIVRLIGVEGAKYYTNELKVIARDPLKNHEVLISLGGEMGRGFDFLANPPQKDDFSYKDQKTLQKITAKVKRTLIESLAEARIAADISRKRMEYIFLSYTTAEMLE